MWNPFKTKPSRPPRTGDTIRDIYGGEYVCTIKDPDVTTVAGYLDDNENYHATKEATLKANEAIKAERERKRRAEIAFKNSLALDEIFKDYIQDGYSSEILLSYLYANELTKKIARNPKKLKDFLNTLEDAQ